jgi:DNA-directed RNA polymerase specialized sigma24 family protein
MSTARSGLKAVQRRRNRPPPNGFAANDYSNDSLAPELGTLRLSAARANSSDYERLLVENLPVLEQIVQAIARRHNLPRHETEDLAGAVRVKLVEDNYATLRRFEHRSSLRIYLTVVVQREFLDRRNSQWGKWRPCQRARRAGPIGFLLDQRPAPGAGPLRPEPTRQGWTLAIDR